MMIFFIFQLHSKQQKQQKATFYTVRRVAREKLNFGLRVCRIFSYVLLLLYIMQITYMEKLISRIISGKFEQYIVSFLLVNQKLRGIKYGEHGQNRVKPAVLAQIGAIKKLLAQGIQIVNFCSSCLSLNSYHAIVAQVRRLKEYHNSKAHNAHSK